MQRAVRQRKQHSKDTVSLESAGSEGEVSRISHLLVWVDTDTVTEMGNAGRIGSLFCSMVEGVG